MSLIKNSQFAKDGIHVTYSDDSTQNLSFADNKLTIDKGLVVSAGGLNATGVAQVNGTLGVSGAVSLANNLAVAGTMANTGAVTMSNTLNVAGVTTLGNALSVAGATNMASTLAVNGATWVNQFNAVQDAHMSSTLGVAGATALASTLAVTGATALASTLAVTGATTLSDTLAVTGAVTLSDSLGVTGATTLTGAASLANTLDVTGATTLRNALTVAGAATMNSGLTVNGTLTHTGASAVSGASTVGGSLTVTGAANVSSTLDVTGAASLHNTLHVDGNTSLDSNLTVAGSTTSGTLNVAGNVGLGLTNPRSKLTIANGNIQLGNDNEYEVAGKIDEVIKFGGSYASNWKYGYAGIEGSETGVSGPQGYGGALNLWTKLDGSGAYEGLSINRGNVGIGTENPTNALTISKSHGGGLMAIKNNSADSMFMELNSNNGAGRSLIGMDNVSGEGLFGSGDAHGFCLGTTTNTSMNFFTNNEGPRMKITPNGHLEVAGAAALNSTLAVTGATTLNSTLGVTGATSLSNTLAVTGATTLSGAASLDNTLAVTGATSLNNTLAVTGAASLSSSLAVTGAATFQNNVTVNGNLTVLGSQTSLNTTSLEVKDAAILIADGNTADIISSGMEMQYKPSGSSVVNYAGVKRLPTTGEFVFFKDSASKIDAPPSFPIIYPTTGAGAKTLLGPGEMPPWEWAGGQYDGAPNIQAAIAHVLSVAPNVKVASWSGGLTGPGRINWYVETTSTTGYGQVYLGPYVGGWIAIQFVAGVPGESLAPSDIYATVLADSFNSASDARLKKDVVTLDGALDKLDAIRGVRYNWIDETASKDSQVGVIAQEIQSVYPELVSEGGNGYLSVDYPKLTAVLIQAAKELKAMIIALSNK